MIKCLAIIGVGLIGGSLALAVKRAGVCQEIVGGGRDEAQLCKALELGVIDRYEIDIATAVHGADMVVVAVPLGAMEEVFRQIAGHVRPDTLITDTGSAKGSVVAAARAAFGAVPQTFVPGHPIAGMEKNGVEASSVDLFEGQRVILTPLPDTQTEALAAVRMLWQHAGAEIVEMEVEHHDAVLAATSHLPHVLAYVLVDMLARMDESQGIFHFAAGGLRDFTRIASSDPVMWRDICLANRVTVLSMLECFSSELASLTAAIRAADETYILSVFTRSKVARDLYYQHKSLVSKEIQ